ncbi:MAG: EAL domain-containing protein [Hyphomicrobium sp.]|jgi:EAL domain-containing protein (putative c-di-GMP-specific phosphodiesterase class I)
MTQFDCNACKTPLDFGITMAFQPIVDVESRSIYAYEALVRGTDGSSAASILARVNDENRYAFDQTCRVRAVELAAALGMTSMLSINFMPNAVYEPAHCLRSTLDAARRTGFPLERIIFETTEDERIVDTAYLKDIFATYRTAGFKTAIDDFGSGYAGLNLLADFQPDIIKIDMALIRNIAGDRARQAIVGALAAVGSLLSIRVIAEGIERKSEALVLRHLGVTLMQGYLFAKPAIEALPAVDFDVLDSGSLESIVA